MFRVLAKFIFFKIIRWKVEGSFDRNIKKSVIIVGPHTSNWDFPLGVLARSIFKIDDAKFLGKSTLFKWPYGFIFRALGGHPVDRTKNNNLVDAVVDIFNSKERFAVALAPEGTRSKVASLKTGFYHIAVKAQIPIYKVGFDYARKAAVIDSPFYPTGDIEADMASVLAFYKQMKGRNPEFGM
jgi:1-acyl-sn-glycerol-3-phosphate acyltransferase